jgi:hypothetical protein
MPQQYGTQHVEGVYYLNFTWNKLLLEIDSPHAAGLHFFMGSPPHARHLPIWTTLSDDIPTPVLFVARALGLTAILIRSTRR